MDSLELLKLKSPSHPVLVFTYIPNPNYDGKSNSTLCYFIPLGGFETLKDADEYIISVMKKTTCIQLDIT